MIRQENYVLDHSVVTNNKEEKLSTCLNLELWDDQPDNQKSMLLNEQLLNVKTVLNQNGDH